MLCGSLLATSAALAAPQAVVPVEGPGFKGELLSIGADGRATFRTVARGAPAETRIVPLEELVRWGHPVPARPQTIVVLADGGQIVTAPDWSGGAPVRLEGDMLVVLSNTLGEVRLPRAAVQGIVFAQRRHATERERLVETLRGEDVPGGAARATKAGGSSPGPSLGGRGSDALVLTNDDRLEGKLVELERGSLRFETAAGAVKLPLSRVEAVALGKRHQSPMTRGQSAVVVGLRDGTLIYADEVRASQNELSLKSSEWQAAGGDVEDVLLLQTFGRRFDYLSDLEPVDYRHVPYLQVEWPYTRDRNVTGEPLAVQGERYLKGIGMHSASRLTYRLDDEFKRFEASIGIDDSAVGRSPSPSRKGRGSAAAGRGSVNFAVYTMRDGDWKEAFKSEVVRGGDAPLPVSVDVSGAEALTLTVDYADRGDEMDRANWLDARLVK